MSLLFRCRGGLLWSVVIVCDNNPVRSVESSVLKETENVFYLLFLVWMIRKQLSNGQFGHCKGASVFGALVPTEDEKCKNLFLFDYDIANLVSTLQVSENCFWCLYNTCRKLFCFSGLRGRKCCYKAHIYRSPREFVKSCLTTCCSR